MEDEKPVVSAIIVTPTATAAADAEATSAIPSVGTIINTPIQFLSPSKIVSRPVSNQKISANSQYGNSHALHFNADCTREVCLDINAFENLLESSKLPILHTEIETESVHQSTDQSPINDTKKAELVGGKERRIVESMNVFKGFANDSVDDFVDDSSDDSGDDSDDDSDHSGADSASTELKNIVKLSVSFYYRARAFIY